MSNLLDHLPTDLSEIKFSRLIRFYDWLPSESEVKATPVAERLRAFDVLAHWLDKDVEYLRNIEISEVLEAYVHLNAMLDLNNFDYNPNAINMLPLDSMTLFKPVEAVRLFSDEATQLAKETLGNYCDALNIRSALSSFKTGEYTSVIYMIAIMFRQKGEQLPLNEIDREAWIDKRGEVIKAELNAFQGLNALFFLDAQYKEYLMRTLTYSLSLE